MIALFIMLLSVNTPPSHFGVIIIILKLGFLFLFVCSGQPTLIIPCIIMSMTIHYMRREFSPGYVDDGSDAIFILMLMVLYVIVLVLVTVVQFLWTEHKNKNQQA
jgi:hypothetical protein